MIERRTSYRGADIIPKRFFGRRNGSDIGAGDDGGENGRLQAIRFVIQILFAQGGDGALETI